VFVDSEPESYGMSLEQAATAIGPRTKAILPVHMYGHPMNADRLLSLARQHGLLVIEDAAEAHGAEVRVGEGWRRCGALGDLSVFSFYANKAITTGEGGMVLCRTADTADRVRSLANLCFQRDRRFFHRELGANYRLTNLQAALGLSQLSRVEATIARKRSVDSRYRELLGDLPGIRLQQVASFARPVPWMVGIVVDDDVPLDGAELSARLDEAGIQTRPFFLGMHEQPALAGRFESKDLAYPVAERLSRRGLYLPSAPLLSDAAIERVCTALAGCLAGRAVPAGASTPPASTQPPSTEPRTTTFGAVYAAAYDTLYADKDYRTETESLVRCFQRYGEGATRDVLDLGCGTARHLIELVRRGYDVTGVDRSPAMLQIAKAAVASQGLAAQLVESEIESLRLPNGGYDAAVMMFAVLSYHTDNRQLQAALRAIRDHLRRDALLLADFWYGPAVLAAPPEDRTLTVDNEGTRWCRRAQGTHDPTSQVVTVRYGVEQTAPDGTQTTIVEEHRMRYFFPQELALLLAGSGFDLVRLTDWPETDRRPSTERYSALLVARAT